MDLKDKPSFRKKMEEVAIKLDRKLDKEQCEVFFKDLRDYPIKIIEKAFDQALKDRDPDDIFLKRAMITIPEIRQVAEDLRREKILIPKIGCERCQPVRGWIIEITKSGRYIAHPCDCLAEMVKAELRRKNRTRADRDHDRYRKGILASYEMSKLL